MSRAVLGTTVAAAALVGGLLTGSAPATADQVQGRLCPAGPLTSDQQESLFSTLESNDGKAANAVKGRTYRLVRELADRRTTTVVTFDTTLHRKSTHTRVTTAGSGRVLSDGQTILDFKARVDVDGDSQNAGYSAVRRVDPPVSDQQRLTNSTLERLGRTGVWVLFAWEDPSDEREYDNPADPVRAVRNALSVDSGPSLVTCAVSGDTVTLTGKNAESTVSATLSLGTGSAIVGLTLTIDHAVDGRIRYAGSTSYTRTAVNKPSNLISGKTYARAKLASYLILFRNAVLAEAGPDVRKASTSSQRVAVLRADAKTVNRHTLERFASDYDDRVNAAFLSRRSNTTSGVTYRLRTNSYVAAKGHVTFTVKGKKIVTSTALD